MAISVHQQHQVANARLVYVTEYLAIEQPDNVLIVAATQRDGIVRNASRNIMEIPSLQTASLALVTLSGHTDRTAIL